MGRLGICPKKCCWVPGGTAHSFDIRELRPVRTKFARRRNLSVQPGWAWRSLARASIVPSRRFSDRRFCPIEVGDLISAWSGSLSIHSIFTERSWCMGSAHTATSPETNVLAPYGSPCGALPQRGKTWAQAVMDPLQREHIKVLGGPLLCIIQKPKPGTLRGSYIRITCLKIGSIWFFFR